MFDTLEIVAEAAAFPIRRLQREDAARIAAFVRTLDRDTLKLRFDRFMPDAAIEAHYIGLDWDAAVLLASEIGPDISGVVEVYPYPAATRPGAVEAEIALVVAHQWRGCGIGNLLLTSGIAAAARCGAVRSTMLLCAGDHGLSRMARRLGFTIDAGDDRAVLAHPGGIGGP